MITWTLNEQQEATIKSWIATHNENKHCPVYKRKKKQEKLKAKGKGNPYGRAAGRYSIKLK